jgi:hypothetical protein
MIASWKYARVGLDKNKKIVALKLHNDDEQASISLAIHNRKNGMEQLRINNKDLIRAVAKSCDISIKPSIRCLVEWDENEHLLIIDLNKVLNQVKS